MKESTSPKLWNTSNSTRKLTPVLASLALHGLILVGALAFRVDAQPPSDSGMEWVDGPGEDEAAPPPEPVVAEVHA